MPPRWTYLDPKEDAEIPWRDVQDAIGQVAAVATGTPRLPILLPVLAISVRAKHFLIPLLEKEKDTLGTLRGATWIS